MATLIKSATPTGIPAAVLPRLIDEGHGPNPWYGADVLSAVEAVEAALAARRPAPGRHNIAEIALHHAYWLHEVRGRLIGGNAVAFPLPGEDWFAWDAASPLSWAEVKRTLATEVQRLRDAVDAIGRGAQSSPLAPEERFDQVLGIAAHGAYHAGQIQLVKALVGVTTG
jgi:hypothetical protein